MYVFPYCRVYGNVSALYSAQHIEEQSSSLFSLTTKLQRSKTKLHTMNTTYTTTIACISLSLRNTTNRNCRIDIAVVRIHTHTSILSIHDVDCYDVYDRSGGSANIYKRIGMIHTNERSRSAFICFCLLVLETCSTRIFRVVRIRKWHLQDSNFIFFKSHSIYKHFEQMLENKLTIMKMSFLYAKFHTLNIFGIVQPNW